jgi:protein-S-isoprenylcysteine O-methyltransferase Ste14
MIAWVDPQPTGYPALLAMAVGLPAFLVSLAFARKRGEPSRGGEQGARKVSSSWIGIGIQGLGFFAVGFGPMAIEQDPLAPLMLGEGLAVLCLIGVALFLFLASSREMGRNWSLVARTRTDHQLVTSGPFARVRHPIYTGLFAFMIGMAIAFGHYRALILGMPLYWIGTWIRVVREEGLLRAQFGADYDAYAARVKRFVPGIV